MHFNTELTTTIINPLHSAGVQAGKPKTKLDEITSSMGQDVVRHGAAATQETRPPVATAAVPTKSETSGGIFRAIANLFARIFSKSSKSKEKAVTSAADQTPTPPEGAGAMARAFLVPGKTAQLAHYLESIGGNVSLQEAINYMDAGEKLAQELANAPPDVPMPPPETKQGAMENVRALSWFLMGQAGMSKPDGSNFVKSGTLRFQDAGKEGIDPKDGGRIYQYLKSMPTSYPRISSHLNELSPDKATFKNAGITGLFGKKVQTGIEDWDRKLPSGGGCILFDRSLDGTTFVKFEKAGLPNVFNPEGSGLLEKLKNAFKALGRCFQHCTSFLETRGKQGIKGEFTHKEHIPGDVLKAFQNGLKLLVTAKVITKSESKANIKEAKLGLSQLNVIVTAMQGRANAKIEGSQTQDQALIEKMRGGVNLLGDAHTLTFNYLHKNDDAGVLQRGNEVPIQGLPPHTTAV